jgi:hypothetical protein
MIIEKEATAPRANKLNPIQRISLLELGISVTSNEIRNILGS